jgi:hypothetical protein
MPMPPVDAGAFVDDEQLPVIAGTSPSQRRNPGGLKIARRHRRRAWC